MKKIIKNSISILLCVVMLFGAAPLEGLTDINLSGALKKIADWFDSVRLSFSASALAASGQCGDNVYWELDEATGTLTISGTGSMTSFSSSSTPFYNNVSIEKVIINYGVTSIGRYIFYNCTNLTDITIPDSVTKIENVAFSGCKRLTGVTIPEGVTSIGGSAFSNCSGLTDITIPGLVTSIGSYAFSQCTGLKEITISNGVKSIEDNAFFKCTGLTDIVIPDSVTKIGNSAFSGCNRLTGVTISRNVTYIGTNAFENCTGLTDISIPDGVTRISYRAFYGCSGLKHIVIPDGVTSIEAQAFCNCTGLISANIPDGVTSIGDKAFYCCTALISADIPDSVTSVGWEAFYYCISLTDITMPAGLTSIEPFTFYSCENLTDIVIPDGVTNIGLRALEHCEKLTSIIIPDSVVSIGERAFAYCTGLTSINIPKNVANIDGSAFTNCSFLTSITVDENNAKYDSRENCSGIIETSSDKLVAGIKNTVIPYGVKSIGENAFYYCEDLLSIVLPDSVTDIEENAFYFCSAMTDIVMPKNLKYIGDNAFSVCKSLIKISIPDSVTYIGQSAFESCVSLTGTVTVPKGVRDISKDAFSRCSSLTEVVISEGVVNIGRRAFCDCSALTDINIPDSIENIENQAFYYCSNLKNVNIPDGIVSISDRVFEGCKSLTDITIPDSVTYIGECAFGACSGLTDITIPETVTYIGNGAFSYCTNIESITFPDSVAYIGDSAIARCENLTDFVIPQGITYIPDRMFFCCSHLKSVTIPDSVTSIGTQSFWACKKLAAISIPDGVVSIGENAFYLCQLLQSITIPNSVTDIGKDAFRFVNNITYSDNWYNNVMHRQGSPWGAKAVDAYVEDGLYYYDSSKELLLGCTPDAEGTVIIPDTVEEVGENCFLNCENVTTINFSSSVYFADTAVSGCDNLQYVIAPDNTDDFGVVYTIPIENNVLFTASVSDNDMSLNENGTGILFCNRNSAGEYVVPDSITHICENAFVNCINVFVEIPGTVSLKSIGAKAFFNSGNYKNAGEWVSNVLIIGGYIVSSKTKLRGKYSLDDDVRGIADRAFEKCTALTGFSCGENSRLSFLGSNAFSGCSASVKNSINLPKSLKYVGENLFTDDSKTDEETEVEAEVKTTLYIDSVLISVAPDVSAFTIRDGTMQIAAGAFSGCTSLESITVPDSVRIIDKNTFSGCMNLKSVALNGNITEIGDNAFADCISLGEITIPVGVNEIGHLAFYGCTGLKSFNVENGNSEYCDIDGVLASADGNTIIQYPAMKDGTEYTIVDNAYVSDLAFYRCRRLQKINIGGNVKYGNRNPFASCVAGFDFGGSSTDILFGDSKKTVLKSVSANVRGTFIIPEGVEEIGSDAFRECTGINKIDFSKADRLEKIGDYAFYGCTGLTAVIIPNTVTEIGRSAFKNCVNLKTVEFEYDEDADYNYKIKEIGDYAFCNCPCNTGNDKWYTFYFDSDSKAYPSIGEHSFYNFENFEDFKNPFCNSVRSDGCGLIFGFKPGSSIDGYVNNSGGSISAYCNTKRAVTGSVITVKNNLDRSENNDNTVIYTAVIFGDVNGDGWYDGTDAMTVSCIASGMLTREDVSEAVWKAADCNRDGEINNEDVFILQQAGVLLSEIEQNSGDEEALTTSSVYNEYLNLVDQSIEFAAESPETPKALIDILTEALIKLLNYILSVFRIMKFG